MLLRVKSDKRLAGDRGKKIIYTKEKKSIAIKKWIFLNRQPVCGYNL